MKNLKGLISHIVQYHKNDIIDTKEYYDKYIKQENDGICIMCGNNTKFINLIKGYKQLCPVCAEHDRLSKMRSTWYNKTINEKQHIHDRQKETWHKKYGVNNISELQIIKNKISDTKKNFDDSKKKLIKQKIQKTCIEKYGVDNYAKTTDWLQKTIDANNKKYGVDYYQQSEQRLLNLPNIQQKIYETKKNNHTFNTSKIEELFAQYLINNNFQFEIQYKSDEYPFNCDFYIPNYDLYIELNLHWTHNTHPFNKTNEKDIQQLNDWNEKSTMSDFYKNAIKVWTLRDVLKQNIAKQNNLNYLVIYSSNIGKIINEFENYITTIKTGFYTYSV